MAIELGSVSLEHLTHVSVRERARLVSHGVPGMNGDLIQVLGRPSVEVEFQGVFYGPDAFTELQKLRDAYLGQKPVDFFAEAVGEGYFAQVVIASLEVTQRAGYLDQYDYSCRVLEYVEPPTPAAAADPFGALNSDLLDEASGLVDTVQSSLDEVSKLTDLLSSVPNFGDPTTKLPSILDDYTSATTDGVAVLTSLRGIF